MSRREHKSLDFEGMQDKHMLSLRYTFHFCMPNKTSKTQNCGRLLPPAAWFPTVTCHLKTRPDSPAVHCPWGMAGSFERVPVVRDQHEDAHSSVS